MTDVIVLKQGRLFFIVELALYELALALEDEYGAIVVWTQGRDGAVQPMLFKWRRG